MSLDNAFCSYDKTKVIDLAKYYPIDFPTHDIIACEHELSEYIFHVHNNDELCNLNRIGMLTIRLVENKNNIVFPLVFCLLKLKLTLLVVTFFVERSFST